MSQIKENCRGKQGCTYRVTTACNCTDPVLFLCSYCAKTHTRVSGPHEFISLDQARELLNDSDSQSYAKLYPRYNRMKQDVQKYVKRLQDLRVKAYSFKQKIVKEIEGAVQAKIDKIDSLIEFGNLRLEGLNKRAVEMSKAEAEMLEKYESIGIRGIIQKYLKAFEINDREIKKTVDMMIILDIDVVYEEEKSQALLKQPLTDKLPSPQKQPLTDKLPSPQKQPLTDKLPYSQKQPLTDKLPSHQKQPLTDKPPSPPKQSLNDKLASPQKHSDSISQPISPSHLSQSKILPRKVQELRSNPNHQVQAPDLSLSLVSPSLFSIRHGSRDLIKYDISHNNITQYSLSPQINHSFYYTSACLLPTGQILISGGWDGILFNKFTHKDTYKVDISQHPPQVSQLSNLNYPRGCIKLICHQDTIYALGGLDIENDTPTNKAESMSLESTTWSLLPSMREARCDFGVHIQDSKIYILGGWFNISVECYDISLRCFRAVNNVQVPISGIVCGVIDDKIYAVGKNDIRIYNREFEEIERNEGRNEEYFNCYSSGEVVEGKLAFIDSYKGRVCQLFAEERRVRVLIHF